MKTFSVILILLVGSVLSYNVYRPEVCYPHKEDPNGEKCFELMDMENIPMINTRFSENSESSDAETPVFESRFGGSPSIFNSLKPFKTKYKTEKKNSIAKSLSKDYECSDEEPILNENLWTIDDFKTPSEMKILPAVYVSPNEDNVQQKQYDEVPPVADYMPLEQSELVQETKDIAGAELGETYLTESDYGPHEIILPYKSNNEAYGKWKKVNWEPMEKVFVKELENCKANQEKPKKPKQEPIDVTTEAVLQKQVTEATTEKIVTTAIQIEKIPETVKPEETKPVTTEKTLPVTLNRELIRNKHKLKLNLLDEIAKAL